MRRTSYQKGSLRLADRKKGKAWEFLWREVQLDGTIRRKHIVIGTQEDLPTESSAQAAVDAIRLEINQQTPQRLIKSVSFETLVNHYRQHELPAIFNKTKPGLDAADEDRKSYSTQVTYEGYLKKWILPRWRSCRLTERQGNRSRKMAQESLFSEDGRSASAGQQGEDQKHHERNLFSCDQMGMDREESNHERSSERETAESTRCSDAGRDHGISQGTARSTPHDDRVGCIHRVTPRRTDRASVAGCGFRKPHLAHTSIGSGDGGRCAENGSFTERCSRGCTNGRVAVGVETPFSVRWSKRLGIRLAAHERPTAVLARDVVAILRQAGFAACEGDEASFVSHFSAHLWDAAECKRGESQGRTGTASPRESESHDRCLHAGSRSTEAPGTEQFGQTGAERRGFGDQAGLSGSNWIMKRSGGIVEAFYFVGVPGGI